MDWATSVREEGEKGVRREREREREGERKRERERERKRTVLVNV